MNLETWLKKHNPTEGPKWYTFDYEGFKKVNLKESTAKIEKIPDVVEKCIMDELTKVQLEDDFGRFTTVRLFGGEIVKDPFKQKYVIDYVFVKNLLSKIKNKLQDGSL